MRKRALAFGALVGLIVAGAAAIVVGSGRGSWGAGARLGEPAGGVAEVAALDAVTKGDGGAGVGIVEDARRYGVRVWSFGLDRYELRIEDAGMTTALDGVLSRTGAELVVNGGFFDPEGRPVGFVMSGGAVLSRLSRSLSGGVFTSDGARAELLATESLSPPDGGASARSGDPQKPLGGVAFAIQCRPRLVVDGVANVKSDDGKRAERTALCTRDAGRTVDVVIVRGSDEGGSPGPSLFALARHLAEAGCESALNLDGGPSTGVAWREGEAVNVLAPRGPVRHVIAFHLRR